MTRLAPFLVLLLCSCAFTPRVVSLQHTEAVTQALDLPALQGLRVHVAEVLDTRSALESWDGVPVNVLPAGFTYRPASDGERKAWDAAVKSPDRSAPRHALGAVRNMYGSVTSSVSSLEDPAAWIGDGLRTELVAHGAQLVDAAEAQVSVQVTLRSMNADLYMAVSAKIAAVVEIRQPGKDPRKITLHTKDSAGAWSGSSWEYYCVMRAAQQKLLWHVLKLVAGGEPPATVGENEPTKQVHRDDVWRNGT